MPRLVVQLSQEEFDRLRDRALFELRHPRHTARLLLREALKLPAREPEQPGPRDQCPRIGRESRAESRVA